MNLRFVFSLIVSLLSLLPAAAQDLTRNWIRERIFLDAEGKECVTSVQYFDGIGRETLVLTDGLSPGGGVAGALTGESFAGRTAVVRDGVLRKKGRSRFILYDRLGSVRSVADEDGNVLQQNLYYARGGAWGDVCTAPGFQSYKYCGKYLDRKHGLDLYDYGARLYDPAAAFWTSPDPLCEKYYNISPYAFCNDNPVTFIDPDGRFIDTAWDAANVAMGVTSFISNVTVGNIVGAALDGAGLIVDVAATAIPGIPGGAATAIKALKGANTIENVAIANYAKKSTPKSRTGRQTRLRELGDEPKLGKADRGWIKQERNNMKRKNRSTIRNPIGKVLAHPRGKEAAKGYSYKESQLQLESNHKLQHKYDNNGKRNKDMGI